MIGETVYHYRILDKIGEGGMGVVYRAEDINLRRTVALKFLSSSSVMHGSTRERIMKEARAAASLDHQNICAIHEVEELDEKLFIVMAYCEGRTLGTLIRDEKPGLEKSLSILIQIADGLCAAHEAGIIHRDIKPANVIVSDKGKVKIMDFGLAKLSSAETKSMTMAGAGTLAYMSPEQVRGDHIDPRSDIWSLGVLMYQMLTGQRPFEGDYEASVLYNIVNEPHVPALKVVPDIPPQIGAIIERALQKSPADRYGSMEEMHNDLVKLRNFLFGEPETVMTQRGFFPGAKHIFGWKLTSVFALSASVVLVFFVIRYIISGGDSDSIDPVGSQLATADDSSSQESSSKANTLYERGRALYNTGNQPKGILLIEQALEIDSEHFEALITLAVYYYWAGDSKKAKTFAARAGKVVIRRGTYESLILVNAVEATIEHNWVKAVEGYKSWY
ncbi:MAG: serine/threonine protein kinase, partial [Candidatus Krumholzibacteria bacterium]|nr:serine/threonine protein kinase [Candidatus Krumholzibacteria bacterium]